MGRNSVFRTAGPTGFFPLYVQPDSGIKMHLQIRDSRAAVLREAAAPWLLLCEESAGKPRLERLAAIWDLASQARHDHPEIAALLIREASLQVNSDLDLIPATSLWDRTLRQLVGERFVIELDSEAAVQGIAGLIRLRHPYLPSPRDLRTLLEALPEDRHVYTSLCALEAVIRNDDGGALAEFVPLMEHDVVARASELLFDDLVHAAALTRAAALDSADALQVMVFERLDSADILRMPFDPLLSVISLADLRDVTQSRLVEIAMPSIFRQLAELSDVALVYVVEKHREHIFSRSTFRTTLHEHLIRRLQSGGLSSLLLGTLLELHGDELRIDGIVIAAVKGIVRKRFTTLPNHVLVECAEGLAKLGVPDTNLFRDIRDRLSPAIYDSPGDVFDMLQSLRPIMVSGTTADEIFEIGGLEESASMQLGVIRRMKRSSESLIRDPRSAYSSSMINLQVAAAKGPISVVRKGDFAKLAWALAVHDYAIPGEELLPPWLTAGYTFAECIASGTWVTGGFSDQEARMLTWAAATQNLDLPEAISEKAFALFRESEEQLHSPRAEEREFLVVLDRVLETLFRGEVVEEHPYFFGFELDRAVNIRGQRIDIEFDGMSFHFVRGSDGSYLHRRGKDLIRDGVLEANGWKVVRVRRSDYAACATPGEKEVFLTEVLTK